MEKEEDNKDKKPRKKLREVFRDVSRKDIPGIAKHTLQDLKKPKEALTFIFAATAGWFIPGSWVGYAGYRIYKYHQKKKQDNPDPPQNN